MPRQRSHFGNVRQLPSGRWQGRWQDDQGHQHVQTRDTADEAWDWLSDEQTDRRRGEWTDARKGKVTFAEWQAQWRETVVLRESTTARDFGYINRYMLDDLGELTLTQIDYMRVTAWVATMRARLARQSKADREAGVTPSPLAPATVVKAAQILGKIMRSAVHARMIPFDPTADVVLPSIDEEEMRILDIDAIHWLADAMDARYRGLVYLGCFGGLRIGELLGAKVAAVNVLRRQVRVTETVVQVGGRSVANAPKTKAGVRTVPLPSIVLRELASNVDGRFFDDLLFPAPRGGVMSATNWRKRYWSKATADLPFTVTPHDMRHTAVSLWIASGATPKEVAVWAGHRSVSTVLDRYGHLFPGFEDRVTDKLELMAAR